MADSEVEDVIPIPFIRDNWIGKGRKVPTPGDTPIGLANYFTTVKEVPENVKNIYYADIHLNVEDFLKIKLPARTYALPGITIEQCFSKNGPNEIIFENFDKRTLPPRRFVEKLNAHFRQAVLDGMWSVVDPAYAGSRLPLWMIRFWTEMWERHEIHERWEKGLKWLDQKIESKSGNEAELYLEARRLARTIRWGEETDIPGANRTATDCFAAYLSESTKMVTSHINMMFSHLSDRVENDDALDCLVAVETLRLWTEINKAKSMNDFNKEPAHFLRRLEQRLKDDKIDYLIFPTRNDVEEHWLTFKLDFRSNELSYGE